MRLAAYDDGTIRPEETTTMTTETYSQALVYVGQERSAEALAERLKVAVNETRTQLRQLEREAEEADMQAIETRDKLRALLRAVANVGAGITSKTEERLGYERYEATFAVGVVNKHHTSGTASKAVATLDISLPVGRTRMEGPSFRGTSSPEKLQQQVDEARGWVESTLQLFTAEAYLRDLGIDPDDVPPVESLVTLETDARVARASFSSNSGWNEPVWRLTVAGRSVTPDLTDLWGIADLITDRQDPAKAGYSDDHRIRRLTLSQSFQTDMTKEQVIELAHAYDKEALEILLRQATRGW